jgi:hypothetical protein
VKTWIDICQYLPAMEPITAEENILYQHLTWDAAWNGQRLLWNVSSYNYLLAIVHGFQTANSSLQV